MAMNRRGITLIEMLVATSVFLVGFVGALSLFTAGVSYRKQSDDLTRCSLALTSLIEEIRIDAGREPPNPITNLPPMPMEYLGDGFADNGVEDGDYSLGMIFPYRLQPGIWYRVETCTDLANADDNATTTALKLNLLVIPFSTADSAMTLGEIGRRLQLRDVDDNLLTDAHAIANRLVDRGIAQRHEVVLVRHRSW